MTVAWLVQAADLLESGTTDMGYDLVLVDEFQDASRARARLARALVKKPHRYLLAVGDDWQSIFRFAGSDIHLMRHFGAEFGGGFTVSVTTVTGELASPSLARYEKESVPTKFCAGV